MRHWLIFLCISLHDRCASSYTAAFSPTGKTRSSKPLRYPLYPRTPFLSSQSFDDGSIDEPEGAAAQQGKTNGSFQKIATSITADETVSVEKIFRIAIPAVCIWLCSPLLSVIDTSAVGLACGTVQQAALNPAVAVIDYSARCMSFLYIGTANLIALSTTDDNGSTNKKQKSASETMIGALRLSLRVGAGLGVFLLAFGTPMLRVLTGNNNDAGDALMAAARKYVSIRALGMPAAAMIGSTQAACLGMKDPKSPLVVTLLAAFVNLVADLALVRYSNAWIGGTAGAAWATVLSQYVSISCYLYWLCGCRSFFPTVRLWKRKNNNKDKSTIDLFPEDANKSNAIQPSDGSLHKDLSDNQKSRKSSSRFSVRGILKGKLRPRDLLFERSNQQKSVSRDFAPYVVPVTTTQVGRCSVYVAMGMVVSGLSVVDMASNQILNSFFYALIPIADALGQTAQVLLPPIFVDANDNNKDANKKKKNAHRQLRVALASFLKAALCCGGALTGIVACIPWLTKTWMTTDPAVCRIVASVVPIHMLIFALHGVFCASEGILLAQKDLGYLGKMYGLYFAVVPAAILQLKRFGTQLELHTLWNVFLAYQLFRISAWVGRVMWLYRRTTKHGIRKEQ